MSFPLRKFLVILQSSKLDPEHRPGNQKKSQVKMWTVGLQMSPQLFWGEASTTKPGEAGFTPREQWHDKGPEIKDRWLGQWREAWIMLAWAVLAMVLISCSKHHSDDGHQCQWKINADGTPCNAENSQMRWTHHFGMKCFDGEFDISCLQKVSLVWGNQILWRRSGTRTSLVDKIVNCHEAGMRKMLMP